MTALQAATQTYYDKAATAFFCGFALRAYAQVHPRFVAPILDLGCGDGRFGAMLLRFLHAPHGVTGIDLSDRAIARARADAALRSRYDLFRTADARDLPFRDQQFATIFSNGVLSSLGGNLPAALAEIRRVLKPGGQVVASMCTNRFSEGYWIGRTLRSCGLTGAAARYTAAMDARTQHAIALPAAQWSRAFADAGLQVRATVGFLPVDQARTWSVLAWSPMRINALLRLAPRRPAQAVGRWAQQRLYARRIEQCPVSIDPQDAAYVLIHAVKAEE